MHESKMTVADKLVMTIMEDEDSAEENYPPKGTPESALVIVLNCDIYDVLGHTGRFFHGECECAGFKGEEVYVDDVPDEPGYFVFENGEPWSHRDWETGYVDDYGISGDWRKARLDDFAKFGVEVPIDGLDR